MAMDQILDFTKDYDYSDEKIKEFRKILKGSLTLVKSMARNEVVMDSVATDFRETLGKATEQMIFFISGTNFIYGPSDVSFLVRFGSVRPVQLGVR